jgi:hypothetical protein
MASPHILRWVSWTVRRNRDFGQAAYYRGLVESRVMSDLRTEGVSDYSMCFDHVVAGTGYTLDVDRLS